MGRIYDLLLVCLATLIGLLTRYTAAPEDITTPLWIMLGIGVLAVLLGRYGLIRFHPRRMTLFGMQTFIYVWSFGIFALIALTVYHLQELGIWLATWLSGESSPFIIKKDDIAAVVKVMMGAISGFVGAAFLSDANKPGSRLWPSNIYLATVTAWIVSYPKFQQSVAPDLYYELNDHKTGLRVKQRRFFELFGPAGSAGKLAEDVDWDNLR